MTTEALVCPKLKGPLSLQTIRLNPVQPDEALVEIHATVICEEDLACMRGTFPARFPCVMGHGASGVVLETGRDVTHVQPNDKVILSYASCENCPSCKSGHPAHCVHFGELNNGQVRPDGTLTLATEDGRNLFGSFFGQSSFARRAIVSKSSLVRVPADTDLKLFAALNLFQTGVGAVMIALNLQPGTSIAVFGAGCVGMNAIVAARIRRAETIIAIDKIPERLEVARKLGATHTILAGNEDIPEKIREICPRLGVQFAVECTGDAPAMEAMMASLGRRGKAVAVGIPPPGTKFRIDVLSAVTLGREYIGAPIGDCEPHQIFPYLIEQHRLGNYPIHELITFYRAEEYQKAINDLEQHKIFAPVLLWK